MKRRIVVILLTFMIASAVPKPVFAQDNMTDDTTTEDTLNENEEGSDKGTLDQSLPDQTSKEDSILDQQAQDTVISSTQITQDDAVSPTIYNQVQQNQDESVQPGWFTDQRGYDFYILEDGAKARGWTVIDNTEYYFDPYYCYLVKSAISHDGYLADKDGIKMAEPGWHEMPNEFGYMTTYYIYPDGKVASGWNEILGKEYYFDTYDGSLTKDLLADGYLVDEEGAKISTPGWYKRYPKNGNPTMHYIKPDGKLAVGWYEVDGNEYLFDQIRGSMEKNITTQEGYRLAWTGEKVTTPGWYIVQESDYYNYKVYIKPDLKVATGWYEVDGKELYFSKREGLMIYGAITEDGYMTHMDGTKIEERGWVTFESWNGNTYWTYIREDGTAPENDCVIDGVKYRFNAGALVQDGDQGIAEPKGQWMYGSNGYWYQRPDGTYPYNEKILIDGQTYYFDDSGYMQTGWQWINDAYYYFNGSGHLLHDCWQWISGNCYYFYADGHMATDTEVDGCYVDPSGAWRTDQWVYSHYAGAYWYSYAKGGYATGFKEIDGETYYFDSLGYMQTGWQLLNGSYYYFNDSGHMLHGCWKWISGNCYYFYADGHMATDTEIDGCYVNPSGAWVY